MAKKSKDEPPNPNNISNRDILQRMNFLYQASVYLNGLGSSVSPPQVPVKPTQAWTRKEKEKQQRIEAKKAFRHPSNLHDLSRFYTQSMKTIGRKTTVRMDPSVKRTICKKCHVVLMPGTTATTRIAPSRSFGNLVVYTCIACKVERRIPAPPIVDSQSELDALRQAESDQPQPSNDTDMAVDQPIHTRRKKSRPAPRLPPLFERKVGHVIFRGNERLDTNQQ